MKGHKSNSFWHVSIFENNLCIWLFRPSWVEDAQCQHPPLPALQKFAQLISDLTHVFDLEAFKACYIFWKDTDEDLMAFNRDQKYIFLNLAYYYKFCE